MKHKILTLVLSIAVIASLLAIGCAPEAAPPEEEVAPLPEEEEAPEAKPFDWRLYGTEDFASQNAPIWTECFKTIGERSGRRLNIETLWLGEHPYEGFDMLDVVSEGMCELGHTQGLDLTGEEPIMGGLSLLFLAPDEQVGRRINNRLNEELISPYLAQKYNLSIVGAAVAGGQAVHASKILNSFDAMEGMRIRVFNKETADAIKLMGGVPQTVEGAEVYSALQKGILDGALTASHYAYDQKWYEVVKYVTKWNEFIFTDNILVALDAYNRLPADLKTLLYDTVDEYSVKVQDRLAEQAEVALEKAIDEYGITVEEMDPDFRAAVIDKVPPVVWTEWAERTGDMADEFFAIVNDELAK